MTDIVERLREMPSSLNDACRAMEEAADEIERLQKGIQDYLNGDYGPAVSKGDKCPHGAFGYEACETCIDDYFRKLLGIKT
jgi:hypothetical protein